VTINGYGVIAKLVADALILKDEMELVGVYCLSMVWTIKKNS
jgi:glyceraldehyde-3-phosphate dehydrogenase/erythrose-4-phosphate dehydrogenase